MPVFILPRSRFFHASLCMVAGWSIAVAATAKPDPGAAIYQKQCVECHGKSGEGNELEEVDALYGDRSVESLTRLIERTMPEEDPKSCIGKDAKAVAQYIYDAFYSPAAREKLGRANVAKIDTARMTVPQYRNAVADLLGSFGMQMPARDFETGGLRGYYFSSKGMNKKEGDAVEKVDGALDLDFGEGPPAEGLNAEQFSIVWEGSFFARDTGQYEFRTSTPNGVRLYLNVPIKKGERNYRDDSSNGERSALIDDWVSSGKEVRQSTAKVFLLGGRRYPIRFDYFKYKEKIGKVRLEWKPPHGAWSIMSGDVLSPSIARPTFVVSAPFPADDRSFGYERGTSISKAWHESTTAGAVEVAAEVDARLGRMSRAGDDDPQRAEKLKDLCTRFAETAFRRPLSDMERKLYIDKQFAGSGDPEVAVKRCVLLCLKSPRFLYPELRAEDQAPDGYTVASRLSFALWDSIPDARLLKAAAEGELNTTGGVAEQARRMLDDPRARAKIGGFFEHWLEMEERDLAKDKSMFPEFDEAVIADLRESLMRFIDEVVWGERSDYRDLLRADYLLLNQRLAKLYGGQIEGGGYQRVPVDPKRRAGVMTHPYLLSAFAYHNNTSPIHRGVFMTRNIIGRALKPPPKAVAFKDDEFDPKLTMREKVTQLTRDTACMSCHSVINPLGFSLENFDAVGRWREKDHNNPVNSKSKYTTIDGKTVSLASARDIANYAASSPSAHRAFTAALFHHVIKQPVAAYGPGALRDLREDFTASNFNIRDLMIEIAKTHALHGRPDLRTANSDLPK